MSGMTLDRGWYASSWNIDGAQGWRIRDDQDALVAWLAGKKADGPPLALITALQEATP